MYKIIVRDSSRLWKKSFSHILWNGFISRDQLSESCLLQVEETRKCGLVWKFQDIAWWKCRLH